MTTPSDQPAFRSDQEPASRSRTAHTKGVRAHGLMRRLLLGFLFLAAIAGGFLWKDRLVEAARALLPAANASRQVLYWTSAMDPTFRSDKPGKDHMGMDLVPVYAGRQVSHGPTVIDPVLTERNYATIPVEKGPLVRTIHTVGTIEYVEPLTVNVRYPRELRDDLIKIKRTLIAAPDGAQIPIEQVADLMVHTGPPVIRSEQARPNTWIYVDVSTSDIGGYVRRAQQIVQNKIISQPDFPTGYNVTWSGQYEYMQQANRRLMIVVPVTLVIVFFLLYVSTRSFFRTLVILLAVPFSLVGSIWFLYFLNYNMSLAVWVGLIALAGVDAEIGAVALLYLDLSYNDFLKRGQMNSLHDLELAVHGGAVKRIRPTTMTVMALLLGLFPMMIGSETGADTMKRLAAPMVGGIVTTYILALLIYPAVFYFYKRWEVLRILRGSKIHQQSLESSTR